MKFKKTFILFYCLALSTLVISGITTAGKRTNQTCMQYEEKPIIIMNEPHGKHCVKINILGTHNTVDFSEQYRFLDKIISKIIEMLVNG